MNDWQDWPPDDYQDFHDLFIEVVRLNYPDPDHDDFLEAAQLALARHLGRVH